jgi:outer membrane protein assembly factor BamB
MKLTIKCDCGGEYDIDFEPVDGKLPGELICPRCNADKTDLVNRLIAAQLASASSPAISSSAATPPPPAPAPEPAPASRQPLRFKKPGSMLAEPSSATPASGTPLPAPALVPPPPAPPPVPTAGTASVEGEKVKLRRPVAAPSSSTPTPSPAAPPSPRTPEPTSSGGGGIRLRRPEDAAPRPPTPAPQPAIAPVPAMAGMPVATESAIPVPPPQDEAAVPQTCSKHVNQPVSMFCFVCKRPMCALCMKKTGFVCSSYCQGKAKEQNIDIPVFEGQESNAVASTGTGRGGHFALGLFLILLGLGCAYGWYRYVGSRPALAFSMPTGASNETELIRFIDANRFVWAHGDTVEMYDAKTRNAVWSYKIKTAVTGESARARDNRYWQTKSREIEAIADPQERETAMWNLMRRHARAMMNDDDASIRVAIADNDVLIGSASSVTRLDRETGTEKSTFPVRGRIDSLSVAKGIALVMSTDFNTGTILTRIQISDGQLQSVVTQPLIEKATVPGAKPSGAGLPSGDDMEDDNRRDYIPAGENFVQMDVELVKKNIVMEDAVRRENQTDLNAVRAGNQVQAINQVMTDITTSRTGGKREVDKSEYKVAIKRHLSNAKIAPWTGIVIGPPKFFSTDTLDLLIDGGTVRAFSKDNKLLWQGKLGYPVDSDTVVNPARPESGPCFERGSMLYIADKGALRAFSISDGRDLWLYPTVGITRIQFDAEGMMYLTTTDKDEASIRYDQEVRFDDKTREVLVKLDARSMGKELWKFSLPAGRNFTSWITGKHVYVTTSNYSRAEMFGAMTGGTGDVPSHLNIYRLSPKTGETIWDFHEARSSSPRSLDFSGNQILIAWPDSIELMRYYDLF